MAYNKLIIKQHLKEAVYAKNVTVMQNPFNASYKATIY